MLILFKLICIIVFSSSLLGISVDDRVLNDPYLYARWKESLAPRGRTYEASPDLTLAIPDIRVFDMYVDQQIDRNETGYVGAWVEGGSPSGTGSYMRILYGYPSNIWTSWVHLNVDGNIYSNRNDVPGVPYFPVIRTYPTNRSPDPSIINPTGQTNETVWEAGGVRFTQWLTPCRIHPNSGTILYQYKVENISGTGHNVGVLLFFDTMINTNDAARISTAYGYNNYQQDFVAPNIPQYWQAYEGPGLAGMVAQGDVIGFNAVMPDRLCIVAWPDIYGDVAWQYTVPVGSTYGDSAMLLYWGWRSGSNFPTRYLPPGASWTVGTYLGIGGVDMGELSVVANYPAFSCEGCRGIRPSPFNIDLTVINTGSRNAPNVQAQITSSIPYPLVLLSSNPVYTTPRDIPVSGTGVCSFTIRIDNPLLVMGNTYNIDIRVSSSDPSIPVNNVRVTLTFPNCSTTGPVATVIRPSPCGGITSCANQDIQIQITGTYGVDPLTIRLVVNGVTHSVGDGETFFSYPMLTYRPRTNYTDGQWVNFELIAANDTTGCPLQAPVSCSFRVDLSPPVVSEPNPPDGSIVTVESPDISARITDLISGVNPSTIVVRVRVNGVIWDPSLYNTYWDGSRIHIRDAYFRNNDLVEVCVLDVADSPTYSYCPPNHISMPYCWSFRVVLDTEGPVATIIEPIPNSYSSCENQRVIMRITDATSRVDPRTIVLNVEGLPYSVDGSTLIYTDSTLIWSPRPGFYADGQVVDVCLISASDIYGNPLQHAPICWQFTMDFTPPIPSDFVPPPLGVITSPTGGVSFSLIDRISGVDTSSIVLRVDGVIYTYPTGFDFSGGRIEWRPRSEWESYDTVEVCLTASDLASYCGANDTTFCYTVYVDLVGPTASIIEPLPFMFSACSDQRIVVLVFDPSGIDTTRGSIVVNGVRYGFDSGRIHFNGDTLVFVPPHNFVDGETIEVVVDEVYDIYGNPLQSPLMWEFYIDLSPPEVVSFGPSNGEYTSNRLFPLYATIWDRYSGIDTSSVVLTVDGVVVNFNMERIGDSIRIRYAPSRQYNEIDTVRVCIEMATDQPDYCRPNGMSFCWLVFVDALGPVAEVVEPINESYSACEDQRILILVRDESGIDQSSARLTINGATFDTSSHMLSFRADTVIFTPPDSFWFDGETVRVSFEISDIMGNPLRDGALLWAFYVDYSPPVVSDPEPIPTSIVSTAQPTITVQVYDRLSGVNPDMIIVRINGVDYTVRTRGLSYDVLTGRLEFDLASAHISFADGESVNVCVVNAMDNPDYCEPNVAPEFCWYFFVDIAGPRARLLEPFNNAVSACADQGVIILVQDRNGVDPSTILLGVGPNSYTVRSPGVMFRNDSLIFEPSRDIWEDGEIVPITLYDARDSLGNSLQGAPLVWQFLVDLSPPYIARSNPSSGGMATSRTPVITFELADRYSRVDTSNIVIIIDSVVVRRSSPAVLVVGNEVRLDTREAGIMFAREDTVSICVVAQDMPDFCPPNVDTLCWMFYVSLSGPWAEAIEPINSSYTACDNQRIIITIEDENGVNPSTIQLEINGRVYTVSSPELFWIPDTLVFVPSFSWENGEVVYVRLIAANDNLGNPLENPLDYSFTVDLTSPVAFDIFPAQASVVTDSMPVISVQLVDSLSGLSEGSIRLYVNGVAYGLGETGTSWHWELATPVSDGYFVLNTELAGIRFAHNDSVEICVEATDAPNYCAPNRLYYCWYYLVDLLGPTCSPITPLPNEISSDRFQPIRIFIADVERSNGVNFNTVILRINGVYYDIGSPELSYVGDTLIFTPSIPWENNEEIRVELVYAEDNLGNPLINPLDYSFFVDLEPPTLINEYPSRSSELEITNPEIRFTLVDNLSGVDFSSISVRIRISGVPGEYVFTPDSPYFVRVDSTVIISTLASGIRIFGGDTVVVCVYSEDNPDIGIPNSSEFCWWFYIPVGGPRVQIVHPAPGTYSACHFDSIMFRLVDLNGVDWNSLVFTVNEDSVIYGDPRVRVRVDTVVFVPSLDWVDGENVRVCIVEAYDNIGNPIDSVFCWSFTIDFSPPVISNIGPVDTVRVRYPTIQAEIVDFISGVDSVYIVVNGVRFSVGDRGVTFDGRRLRLEPGVAGLSMRGGDTFNICVYGFDSPDYCGPNSSDSCWSFMIEPGGPVASIIEPLPLTTSACDPLVILVSLFDPNGVDRSTIVLRVNGRNYDISSGYLSYNDSVLSFNGGRGFFADGETVYVELISADDILGNRLSSPLRWFFVVDYSPPYYMNESPGRGSTVEDTRPVVAFDVFDSVSGVDSSRVRVRVNGVFYDLSSPGVSFEGGRFVFNPVDAGITWVGGTVVEICPELYDTPDYCEPNRSFECYSFSISRGGPEARIIEPLPETYSACVPQAVVMSLTDRNGIDTSTIILVVQGDTFDISSPELSYEEPYLRFEPTVPFFDGETVYVELVSARDNLFNPIDSALSWHFVMDFSSPVIADIVPAPDSIVDVRQPRISFSLFDELSGLDQSSIRIEIGSNVFVPGARGTSWNGRDFVFYPESLGIFWRGGDRIDICVHAADRPHYCEPNMLDTCWAIYIATGGPIATVIEPLNRTISTCRDQRIVVRLWDRDGVNLSTVRIMVDSVLYTLDSVSVLEYRADTLIFTPRSGQWRDSDTVFVALLAAEDNLGNPLERAPVRWSFMLDFSPPVLVYNYPTDMSYVTNWQDSIVARFVDNLLGVDSSSFVLTLTGVFMHRDPIFFGFGDRGLRWTGSGFIFSPRDIDQTRFGITYPYELEGFSGLYFAEFETIGVSLYIADNPPNYCDPNPAVYGFRFVVADDDTLPPEFIEFSPSYYSWNMPFYITVVVTDSSGVYENGAYLIWDDDGSVDDGSFSLVALVVDSVIDSYTIRFRTSEPIPAQRIGADFVYRVFAYDNDYDFLNPRDRMLGSAYGMVRILEGPYAYPVEPLPNTVTSCSDQSIIIRLVDSDGVDERSILLKINDSLFTIEDPRLSYIGDSLLIFDPEDGYFANEQVVRVELVQALDNLGNPRFDTLRFTFAVDLEPPQFVFTFPGDSGMVHDPTMPIEILVTDNLSGVNLDSLVLIANGRTYRIGTGLRFIGNRVIFTPPAGVFRSGDTISVAIYAADSPDYCLPNASSASWIYIIEPSVPCDAHPNPFTPNSDGYNDIVIFNYPNMFSQDAELIIYNRWNEEIIRKSLYRVHDFFTISQRFWDGKDKTGKPVQPGVYIYVIKMRGEIVCSGTITVAR